VPEPDATENSADPALLPQARALVPPLYGLSRALRLQGVTEAGLDQLPPSELEVLRYVLDAPGTTLSTLARDLTLQTSNASTVVRGLVARGLLERDTDPGDRRSVRLRPTMAAQHGMARIEDCWAQLVSAALGDLPDQDRAALVAAGPALQALSATLRKRRTP
jgi:DNA-binding MarR family transcriptional regulator